ncbi:MAG: dihydropteroate synthase [Acidobacteriota bacterium]
MSAIAPRPSFIVPCAHGHALALGPRTLVMGIVNVTPDSFAGGITDPDEAAALACEMEAQGAHLVDIGGESTRPGAEAVPSQVELGRVVPVIERLAGRIGIPISIDTYKTEVAEAAILAGAALVNDVSGLGYDPRLGSVAARRGAGLILMHTRGRSRDMYREAVYQDVAGEVAAELRLSLARAEAEGVGRDRIVIDPGLGFAKRADDSYAVLAALPRLQALGRPVLVGPSRKSFLAQALGETDPAGREWGTAAAVASAILLGAHIVRVHGVREMVHVARVADMIRQRAGV